MTARAVIVASVIVLWCSAFLAGLLVPYLGSVVIATVGLFVGGTGLRVGLDWRDRLNEEGSRDGSTATR